MQLTHPEGIHAESKRWVLLKIKIGLLLKLKIKVLLKVKTGVLLKVKTGLLLKLKFEVLLKIKIWVLLKLVKVKIGVLLKANIWVLHVAHRYGDLDAELLIKPEKMLTLSGFKPRTVGVNEMEVDSYICFDYTSLLVSWQGVRPKSGGPGFDPCFPCGALSWSSHTIDLKTDTPVTTLQALDVVGSAVGLVGLVFVVTG